MHKCILIVNVIVYNCGSSAWTLCESEENCPHTSTKNYQNISSLIVIEQKLKSEEKYPTAFDSDDT